MSRFITGPWLRAARFADGLLVPGRPRGRGLDLLLTAEQALIRGSGELVLPWSAHLGLVQREMSAEGWFICGWGGKGAGAAVDLQGSLMEASRELPLMRTLSARVASTPVGGGRAPLDRLSRFDRQADKDVLNALCSTLAAHPDLRSRLADSNAVNALLVQVKKTPHRRGYELEGVRQQTIATSNALKQLGYVHRLGGRPLPGTAVPAASDVLPLVLERIRASPYAQGVSIMEEEVLALIERGYCSQKPWPFEPLFG